jgi:uncharacterized protein YyaL (SSP411 family)
MFDKKKVVIKSTQISATKQLVILAKIWRAGRRSGNLGSCSFYVEKIGSGGIYDQIGGGFARYSVDHYWHIPHFEKMLYDNGQLLSLYAEAYQQSQDPFYKRIIEETITGPSVKCLHQTMVSIAL